MIFNSLADAYRMAGISPGVELLNLRQSPFDKLRKAMDAKMAVNLSRLLFGLNLPDGIEWFRDAFYENDSSFSMHENQQEVAVLSACLLDAAIADEEYYAGLAVLSISMLGNRTPIILQDFPKQVEHLLNESVVKSRQRSPADPQKIKQPAKPKTGPAIEALAAGAAWDKVSELLKQMSDESSEISRTIVNQIYSVIYPLTKDLADVKEEVNILWWHIGGWSRILDKPFSDFNASTAAVLAGIDLSDLSNSPLGHLAAPAILQRTIASNRKGRLAKTSISEAVSGLTEEQLEALDLGEIIKSYTDTCPLLAAFLKAHEIGAGSSWHNAYTKATHIDPSITLSPMSFALQAYRESQLLDSLT